MCGADGRWNPDPATLVCTCEYPPMAYILVCVCIEHYTKYAWHFEVYTD